MSRLRDWREAQALTLDEVGALTGYSRSFLSRIERGQQELRPLDKVNFARRLGGPLRELFEVVDPVHEPEEVSTP